MSFDADTVPLVVALVALFVGVLGAVVSTAGILQRQRADRREALWQRSQAAIAMSQSDRPRERLLGTEMIKLLLDQDELTDNDAALLVLAAEAAVVHGDAISAGVDETDAMRALRGGADRDVPGSALDGDTQEAHDEHDEGGS